MLSAERFLSGQKGSSGALRVEGPTCSLPRRPAALPILRPLRVSRDASDWPPPPELAAPLGGWRLSQHTEGVGDSSCVSLYGVVAVPGRCIVTARHPRPHLTGH